MGFHLGWILICLSNRENRLMITLLLLFTWLKCQSSAYVVRLVPIRGLKPCLVWRWSYPPFLAVELHDLCRSFSAEPFYLSQQIWYLVFIKFINFALYFAESPSQALHLFSDHWEKELVIIIGSLWWVAWAVLFMEGLYYPERKEFNFHGEKLRWSNIKRVK